MIFLILPLLLLFACRPPGPRSAELTDLASLDPTFHLEIRYATQDNFTGKILYPQARCLLQQEAAQSLLRVQGELRKKGLGLKLWDCYRPLSIQKKLWRLVPDERYVADPKKGSRHNRAAAVDVTLVDLQGQELPMPTGFDDFSERAHRSYRGAGPQALQNRKILEQDMERQGFRGLESEWWHFDYRGWENYPLLDLPLE
ncbi:MAG: D-alanyl-D-alanine dipeptidase [Elusimicrobia bacterium]|nr:D-alanyl-D-alanine dipeptidase [Elusimicrobiota bacterium]